MSCTIVLRVVCITRQMYSKSPELYLTLAFSYAEPLCLNSRLGMKTNFANSSYDIDKQKDDITLQGFGTKSICPAWGIQCLSNSIKSADPALLQVVHVGLPLAILAGCLLVFYCVWLKCIASFALQHILLHICSEVYASRLSGELIVLIICSNNEDISTWPSQQELECVSIVSALMHTNMYIYKSNVHTHTLYHHPFAAVMGFF